MDEALVSLVLQLRQQRGDEINLKRRRSSIQVSSSFYHIHHLYNLITTFTYMCIKMIIRGGRRFAEESALAGAQEDLMKFQTNSEHKMIFRETQNKNNIWKYWY